MIFDVWCSKVPQGAPCFFLLPYRRDQILHTQHTGWTGCPDRAKRTCFAVCCLLLLPLGALVQGHCSSKPLTSNQKPGLLDCLGFVYSCSAAYMDTISKGAGSLLTPLPGHSPLPALVACGCGAVGPGYTAGAGAVGLQPPAAGRRVRYVVPICSKASPLSHCRAIRS
jgi:hypothetical protein